MGLFGLKEVHREVTVDVDPRLPAVGEIVALQPQGGARLWVARVRSVEPGRLSLQEAPDFFRRAQHEVLVRGERVMLSGLAGTPIQAEAVVLGDNGSILLLQDVVVAAQRPDRMLERIPVRGQVWCDLQYGAGGSLVDVLDISLGGVCVSTPPSVRLGDELSLADPAQRHREPVWGMVVGRTESLLGTGQVHVGFVAGTTPDAVERLASGLVVLAIGAEGAYVGASTL